MCFWTLSHILTSPTLLAAVKAETSNACRPDGSLDLELLTTSCPHLDSTWHESLRLYSANTLLRIAIRPTTVDGKAIQLGDQVMSPFRQFHLNKDLFGDDALEWNGDRFRENKDLLRNKAYHPFGGGATYCPGRFLAKQEVFTLVALVLYRFDVELEEGARQPTVNLKEPSMGVMRPIGDLNVKLRERRRGKE